jgi:hypothetical protein
VEGDCGRRRGEGSGHFSKVLKEVMSDAPRTAGSARLPRPCPPRPQEQPAEDRLPRRLTGPINHHADPLGVAGVLLASAKLAGLPFDEAWTVMEEAALSYLSDKQAADWHDVLDGTRSAWEDAYSGRPSKLSAFDPDMLADLTPPGPVDRSMPPVVTTAKPPRRGDWDFSAGRPRALPVA